MEKNHAASGDCRYNRISFYLNGESITLDLPPGITSLEMLNQELNMYGTKCSCNEGDCGACTVVIAYPRAGTIVYEAINSCLYPAARLHGKHLITIEGLGTPEDLHPIQQAILDHHASQCGYCTPGFVMSLFALLAGTLNPDAESILAALEGNLCRCTGYQSILEAAQELSASMNPQSVLPDFCRMIEPKLFAFDTAVSESLAPKDSPRLIKHYHKAQSTTELHSFLAAYPQARLIAGGTDIMVQVNVGRKHFEHLIDLGDIPELQEIQLKRDGIHIGAGVSYSQLMDSGIIKCDLPCLVDLCRLIASKQIRNFGTLAGNIANASPVGDSLPLLLVLEAKLILASAQQMREIKISEFFLDYRQTALQKGEYIREIIIPSPPRDAFIQTRKSSKRKSVDISSVVSAIRIDKSGKALLAFGGVAATPVLSTVFREHFQAGADLATLAEKIVTEYAPLSDVRGSAEYRSKMIYNHILQYREAYHG